MRANLKMIKLLPNIYAEVPTSIGVYHRFDTYQAIMFLFYMSNILKKFII